MGILCRDIPHPSLALEGGTSCMDRGLVDGKGGAPAWLLFSSVPPWSEEGPVRGAGGTLACTWEGSRGTRQACRGVALQRSTPTDWCGCCSVGGDPSCPLHCPWGGRSHWSTGNRETALRHQPIGCHLPEDWTSCWFSRGGTAGLRVESLGHLNRSHRLRCFGRASLGRAQLHRRTCPWASS